MNLQAAASIVAQGLRAVVVIPLYASSRAASEGTVWMCAGRFFGRAVSGLKTPTAFTKLDRQILDALAADAASILDNAGWWNANENGNGWSKRLASRETFSRPCCRKISRIIRTWRPWREFSLLVGRGDYFDVFPWIEKRTAFLLAT